MKEEFLHFIWEHALFDKSNLRTTGDEPVEIVTIGQHNTDAGPDFFNAKIKIGDTLWAGNVEIHRRSSDWARHAHSSDKNYDNVILHVVLEDDRPVARPDGQWLPTLVMRYAPELGQSYTALLQSPAWAPCRDALKQIEPFRINYFLGRLLVERMERKSQQIVDVLQTTQNDWREVFYQLLFRAFGFSINAAPFEMLAKATPLAAIGKHRHSLMQIEALLFGQAGFLQGEATDAYHRTLQTEYAFLQTKFSLTPLEKHIWKFLRLRPFSFPTVRIAQLAKLLQQAHHLIDKILYFRSIDELYTLFDVRASEYWDTHYRFEKTAKQHPKVLGRASIERILVNLVTPFLFTYGRWQGDETLCDRALALLETLPPEKNQITAGWERLGLTADNAFYTQALIQLKTNYCNNRQCLKCSIGADLLRSTVKPEAPL
ncbi:MAG: DUF2851 family protein [Prevotellaceae bacterium]|jgi:hypothetical protein|nr:DUF2851 family protein [Prevotellaceae bacterium]